MSWLASPVGRSQFLHPFTVGRTSLCFYYANVHIRWQWVLTLNPAASTVYWFPMGCAQYITYMSVTHQHDRQVNAFHHTDSFMMCSDVLHFCPVHRHGRKMLKTYSGSSWPKGSTSNTGFDSLSLSWAEQSLFKTAKNLPKRFPLVLATKNLHKELFLYLLNR